jgi:hypothetical protein
VLESGGPFHLGITQFVTSCLDRLAEVMLAHTSNGHKCGPPLPPIFNGLNERVGERQNQRELCSARSWTSRRAKSKVGRLPLPRWTMTVCPVLHGTEFYFALILACTRTGR